jgi:HlyD family secretion protein
MADFKMQRTARRWGVLAIVFATLGLLAGCAHGASDGVEAPPEVVTVERGSLATSITALGSIRPGAEALLSFQVPGRVTEVLVRAGQQVQREQPLARLETADLELQVRSAEASLAAARAQLAQIQAGPKAGEIRAARGQLAAAQAALDQAVAQRDQLITGTLQSDVVVAESQLASAQARVRQLERQREQLVAQDPAPDVVVTQVERERAKIALDETQDEYNKALDRPWEEQEIRDGWAKELQQAQLNDRQAQAQLDRAVNSQRAHAISLQVFTEQIKEAQTAVRAAQAQLEQIQGSQEPQQRATEAAVAAARAQRDIAQAQLDVLLAGATSAEIAAAQAQVDQAQVALDAARLELERATLYAPFEGVVSWVDVDPGQTASPQTPALTLVNEGQFSIEAEVDEADVGWLRVGQQAWIDLDAFPGRTLTGSIVAILPSAIVDLGVVSYQVTIAIEPNDLTLRAGMTANAEIVREQREDVLLVPNRAIWIDAQSGRPYVEQEIEGEPAVTYIEQGLANDEFSEIVSGLREGDRLLVRSGSIRDRFREVVTTSMTGQ